MHQPVSINNNSSHMRTPNEPPGATEAKSFKWDGRVIIVQLGSVVVALEGGLWSRQVVALEVR